MVCSVTSAEDLRDNGVIEASRLQDTPPQIVVATRDRTSLIDGMSSLSDAHRRNGHIDSGDRSSSAGSSLGSCSPPPASSHSPPPPRPPWLHDFHAAASPHVLQFLNLSAGAGGMLGSQPLAALHSMAERSHHHQQQQQQQLHHQQQQAQAQAQAQQQQQQQLQRQQQAAVHLQSGQISTPPQGQSSPTGSGKHSPATSITSVGSNPHGIDTILSRPAATHPQIPVTAAHALSSTPTHPSHLTAPRYAMHAGFTGSAGKSSFFILFSLLIIIKMKKYLYIAAAARMIFLYSSININKKTTLKEIHLMINESFSIFSGLGQFQQRTEARHPAVYWPGLQGLVSDPLAWRARLHSRKFFFIINLDVYISRLIFYSKQNNQCFTRILVKTFKQLIKPHSNFP